MPDPKKEYHGWANYYTWSIINWFFSSETITHLMLQTVPRNKAETRALAKLIMPDGTPDFENGAKDYRHVNWAQIRQAWRELVRG